jgi:unsaturated rhamnogalacturonyl hydrolase
MPINLLQDRKKGSLDTRRNYFPVGLTTLATLLLAPLACAPIWAQSVPAAQKPTAAAVPARWIGAGDTPDDAGPLATDLSPAITTAAIDKAMRKVGDWQLERGRSHFTQDWTFSALYTGFIAAADALPDPAYQAAMVDVGKKYNWTLGARLNHADDHVIGQMYLSLYLKLHDPKMMTPTKTQFDQLMTIPDDPAKPVWSWCDALFMGPDTWAKLYKATGNKAYLEYIDREWWITSKLLYDPAQHLYFRDATFLDKKEKNGQPLFWSRGNGWVLAGLARVLQDMPADYPTRQKYVDQYQQMAKTIAALQGSDGLWRTGLLDQSSYALPEDSGSAFFVFAMAWGINHHLLDEKIYLPVVEKGWKGLIGHVYADGRLGWIQPIGAAPGAFTPTSSYVYGVGAFLLAGSELKQLHPAHAKR